jgi:colicin import membrane protein
VGGTEESAAREEVEKQAKLVAIAAKRLKAAGKDAAAVDKTLKAEAAARAAIQDKAIKRARAEVKNRVAAALASSPDATADEIKEATKAKARYEFADAEARLAEMQQSVDGAKDRAAKAADARKKTVTAMSGKSLNTSQTEFLSNVKRRATDAQNIVDELEKVGGPLNLAEQKVIAMKLALDTAESA